MTRSVHAPRQLHPSLRGKRLALVLSGGGALGAYEVGVLRVLERIGLDPAIVAGNSVGALNAVGWVALGGRTKPLMRMWRGLNASGLGLRWSTLGVRIAGAFLAGLGAAELAMSLAGPDNLSAWMRGRLKPPPALVPGSSDLVAWLFLLGLGLLLLRGTRWAETMLALWPIGRRVVPARRFMAWLTLMLLALPVLAVLFSWSWPFRANLVLTGVCAASWMVLRFPGRAGALFQAILLRTLPDTRGSGLWSGAARQRIVDNLVGEGDVHRLARKRIILSACALDSGTVTYFVNWPTDPERFARRMGQPQDRVVVLDQPEEVLAAAMASSALPLVFEPVLLRGERYVDSAMLSNQPLQASLAAGADAALVVLLSSITTGPRVPLTNLFSVGARLLEIGQLRDARMDLQRLPPSWRESSRPRPLCIVEPSSALPGGVLGFDPRRHGRLMERGRHDAWRALELAGWLVPASD